MLLLLLLLFMSNLKMFVYALDCTSLMKLCLLIDATAMDDNYGRSFVVSSSFN